MTRFTEAWYGRETFTLVELEEGEVKGVKVIENPYRREPYGAGSKVALFLVNLGVNAIISRTDCPKGKMILDSAGLGWSSLMRP